MGWSLVSKIREHAACRTDNDVLIVPRDKSTIFEGLATKKNYCYLSDNVGVVEKSWTPSGRRSNVEIGSFVEERAF